jgi:hypothetical protein
MFWGKRKLIAKPALLKDVTEGLMREDEGEGTPAHRTEQPVS